MNPGYQGGNQAGANTQRRVEAARRADRIALLGRYRMERECCGGSKVKQNEQAVLGGDLLARTVERTVAAGVVGRQALSSGVYIRNLEKEVVEASKERFAAYVRYEPPAPCPTYVINPAVAVPSDKYCYPTRFTGNPRY
jgi:hypothetical protein